MEQHAKGRLWAAFFVVREVYHVHLEHLCSLPGEAPTPDPLICPPVGETSYYAPVKATHLKCCVAVNLPSCSSQAASQEEP
jgi:hypothetical protein